ncbi:hypothetical protein [Calothrix sp. NIES-2100]
MRSPKKSSDRILEKTRRSHCLPTQAIALCYFQIGVKFFAPS